VSGAARVRETARAAYDSGDFETAIELVESALAATPSDDEVTPALLRCDLARYLYLKGRGREADEQLRLAEPVAEREGGEPRAAWLSSKAWLHLNHLEFGPAHAAAQEALRLARDLGLARVEAESLGQIATIEVHDHGAERGLPRAEEALAAARAVPDPDLVAETTINVATSLELGGDPDAAIAYLERGQRELASVRGVLVADFLTLCLAQLLAHRGRTAKARELLDDLAPARLDGVVGVFFRIVQAELAVAVGDLSGAMLWIDGIDVSGWAYSDQWNAELDDLLDTVRRGFDEASPV